MGAMPIRCARRWRVGGLFPLALLAACGPGGAGHGDGAEAPGDGAAAHAYNGIHPDEVIRFTGTEPFWGGTVAGESLTWTTPENQDGMTIPVQRFAGNSGLGMSGLLDGRTFDMTVTPGTCSDGMSDRSYPFTVTVKRGEEQLQGCAWTDKRPFTGPRQP